MRELGAARSISFIAQTEDGLLSLPRVINVTDRANYRGTLRAVIIGVDKYHKDTIVDLSYAVSDGRRFATALRRLVAGHYAAYDVVELFDTQASPERIKNTVRDMANATGSSDTLIIFIAGHGMVTSEGFALALPPTGTGGDLQMFEFSQVAEFIRDANGRILVVLDACHSGGANADAGVELLTLANPNVVVLSASKGRQSSLEGQRWGGGVFTAALVDAMNHQMSPAMPVSIDDIYTTVKREVSVETGGEQTPWLRRANWAGPEPFN